jgi:hypothetical protein
MQTDHLSDSDYLALTRLVAELAWRIDHDKGAIPELFTDDAVIVEGPPLDERYEGRQGIDHWADIRPPWMTHVMTNVRWSSDGPERAIGDCVLTAYHDPEHHEYEGTTLPIAVAVIALRCVRTAAGWRIDQARGDFRFTRPGSHAS